MPLPRSLSETLGALADNIKHDFAKVLPATVTAVYPARQTVDVQIAINNQIFDDLGNAYSEPAPSLSDVPLGVMRGGGFMVWMPVAVGDSVLLVFSDLSTDTWRAGNGQPSDPGFMGKHTMDSAFAIPVVSPDANFFADPAADPGEMIVGADGSAAQVRLSTTLIKLGNSPTDFVALASKVDAIFNALQNAVMTWVVVAGDGGAAGKAALTTALTGISTVGSALIKAQ